MLNLNQLKNLYQNSPLWLKKLYASIPYDIRNGNEYRKWKNFLETEINEEEYQLLKLKETIDYAYSNTIYYKKVFDNLKCSVNDINDLKDIQKLPFIDKETVKNNYDDMIAKTYPKNKTFVVTTGGTSGEPMQFLQSKNVWSKELAFVNNYFSRYGYSSNMLKASFRGGKFNELRENIFWKYNPISNEIHFSPFYINSKTIYRYIDQLNKIKPRFLHGYPSSIFALIENMKNADLKLNYDLKAVFLISENFSKDDINYICNFFNCKVTSFFGHSERLIFAPLNSKDHNSYEINKRYGLSELIDKDKQSIYESDKMGELIGTSFDNYAMPLIRYKTNDFTSYSDFENGTLNLIQGRWNREYLSGKDGLKLTLTALNMHSDIFENVLSYQFFQDEIGKVKLLIVPKKNYSREDGVKILKALDEKGGHALEFDIKIIDSPFLTERGKMKKLIKNLSEQL